jgi:hypothetical protein
VALAITVNELLHQGQAYEVVGLCTQAAERIKETVQAGAYYEAQQMYKAAYHRHRSRKQLAESYAILKVRAASMLQSRKCTNWDTWL